MTKFAQGKFQIKNIEKYIGKKTPTYRSSWEFAMMTMLDNNPAILQWASEPFFVPYRNPFNGRNTFYVPDFLMVYVDKNGKKHADIVEVKPKRETKLEHAGRSKKAQYAAVLNAAKWQAASAWCKANGFTMKIVTEEQLFFQGKKK